MIEEHRKKELAEDFISFEDEKEVSTGSEIPFFNFGNSCLDSRIFEQPANCYSMRFSLCDLEESKKSFPSKLTSDFLHSSFPPYAGERRGFAQMKYPNSCVSYSLNSKVMINSQDNVDQEMKSKIISKIMSRPDLLLLLSSQYQINSIEVLDSFD
jgi:hypothetical protein